MSIFAGSGRSTWVSALVLLVVATFVLPGCEDQEAITPPESQETVVPSLSEAPGHAKAEVSERRVIELPNGRVLEELRGEPADRHLQQLMSRRPEAFANLSLWARGYRPSEEVLVQRIRRPQNAANLGNGFTLVQDVAESTSEGEITFWSWDDGDDSTWEGVVWFEDYDSGVAGTNEVQVDISTEETTLVFLNNTWESEATGGGGEPPIMTMWGTTPCATVAPAVSFASYDAGSERAVGDYALASAMGWDWGKWGKCTLIGGTAGCAGAATGCMLSGPGWAKCTAAFCAGSFVTGALGCAGAQF